MDIFFPIVVFVITCILLSICGWCCKRKREGTVFGPDHITISSQPVSASPVVVPPYPVEPRFPMPHQSAPMAGFVPNPPYPSYNPHMTPGGVTPYPPLSTPYPPAPYTAQPPSYSEAVSHPPIQPPPINEGYAKQAPYNPHY